MRVRGWVLAASIVAVGMAADDDGFKSLFDGETLQGWQQVGKRGPSYKVEQGLLVCPKGCGNNLLTVDEYSNFILKFDFRVEPGGNNGIGIRAPKLGDAAYQGMEIQILDDDHPMYAQLKPYQYHGSVYGVFPAKRGSLKKAGEWNSEGIVCDGKRVRITVNGQVVVDADIGSVTDPAVLKEHPGLLRSTGYIALLGHTSRVEFRNIRVKTLP